MAFFDGIAAPFLGTLAPGKAFDRLREVLDAVGPWALFPLWLGASVTAVVVSMILTYPLYVFHGFGKGVLAGFSSFLTGIVASVYYSLLVPLVFGVLDPLLILVALIPAPRERPLYYVFAARAGAMLPYAIRPPLVLLTGGTLSLYTILVPQGLVSWLIALGGWALTGYGVRKTVKVPLAWALLASGVALAVRILIGYATTL